MLEDHSELHEDWMSKVCLSQEVRWQQMDIRTEKYLHFFHGLWKEKWRQA